MQKLDARPQYQEFLRIRQGATDDPLVGDARKRLAGGGEQRGSSGGKRDGKDANATRWTF